MTMDEAAVATRSSTQRESHARRAATGPYDGAPPSPVGNGLSEPPKPRWRGLRHRFASRLVAATLLVSVPLMLVLAAILTTQASTSLTSSAKLTGRAVAIAVTLRLENWLSQRRADMQVAAGTASGQLASPATAALLAHLDKASGSYLRIDVVDLRGKTLASSRTGSGSSVVGQDWFREVSAGKPILTTLVR